MNAQQVVNDQTVLEAPDEAKLEELLLEEEVEGFEDEELEQEFFITPPLLMVDTDPDRAVARQKEMMDFCFDGIGTETKEEKRMGLAMQQFDIEQRHAMRLLLIYQDPVELTAHLQKCLADAGYGYGKRGDNGRTIAQAMAALVEDGDLGNLVSAWLEAHQQFQQEVLQGAPMSFRSLFDYSTLDSFVPILQRIEKQTWRLGVEEVGKFLDFQGPIAETWKHICDTYVKWCDEDNDAWFNEAKRKAAKLPDSILRAARADRLRKEKDQTEIHGAKIVLNTERNSEDWPRITTMALDDEEHTPFLGLSRLSGHSFYELSWDGGQMVRRFEISSTTRNKIPFEHIELATMVAEAIGLECGLKPDPVNPEEVEAAYLRRMKATGAEISPAKINELPHTVQGKPAASYMVHDITVTMLQGGSDFAYVTNGIETGVLVRHEPQKGRLVAIPVTHGRPRRSEVLMSTPMAELDLKNAAWNRSVCAWSAWLLWSLQPKSKAKVIAEDE